MLNLESVGTGLDDNGMIYPMLDNGGWEYEYDYDNGIHLDDIEPGGDWMLSLSYYDECRISDWVFSEIKWRTDLVKRLSENCKG